MSNKRPLPLSPSLSPESDCTPLTLKLKMGHSIYYRKKNAAPPLELLQGPTSVIEVSDTSRTYYIHKRLLCQYSKYFDAALNGYFSEALTQTIKLDDEDPETFEILVWWLYSGRIELPAHKKKRPRDIQGSLVKLWLLADRRGMPALQNHTLDALHQSVCDLWDFGDSIIIGSLFDETADSAKIRDWVVETWSSFADTDRLDRKINSLSLSEAEDWYPPSFLFKLSRRLLRDVEKGPRSTDYRQVVRDMDICQFHEHLNGETCADLNARYDTTEETQVILAKGSSRRSSETKTSSTSTKRVKRAE